MLVEFGAMKIPRAPPVRLRIACHFEVEKNRSAVLRGRLSRGRLGCCALLYSFARLDWWVLLRSLPQLAARPERLR